MDLSTSANASSVPWTHPGCVTLKALFKDVHTAKAKVDLLTIELFNATEALERLQHQAKSHDCHSHVPLKHLAPMALQQQQQPVPEKHAMTEPVPKHHDALITLAPPAPSPSPSLPQYQPQQLQLSESSNARSIVAEDDDDETQAPAGFLHKLYLQQQQHSLQEDEEPHNEKESFAVSPSHENLFAAIEKSAEVQCETMAVETLNFDYIDNGDDDYDYSQGGSHDDAVHDSLDNDKEKQQPLRLKRGWTNNNDGEVSPPPTPSKRPHLAPPALRKSVSFAADVPADVDVVSAAAAEADVDVPTAEKPAGAVRATWRRSKATMRLRRLATNDEDLRKVLQRMAARATEQQEQHQQPRLRHGRRRHHRSHRDTSKRSSGVDFDHRTRTMEETVKEGCEWLLAMMSA